MGHLKQQIDGLDSGARRSRRRARLSAVAVALLAAATLAACGDDSSSDTTSTTAGTTATQATTETGVGTTSTTDTGTATTESTESNGVEDKSAEEIVAAASDAAQNASAVHVTGKVDDVEIDLSLVRDRGAVGSIAQSTARFDLITIGDEIYLRGSEAFYRSLGGDAVVRLLGDKWLKVPAGGRGFESFAAFTDMGKLMREALRAEGRSLTKGDVESVDGVDAVPVIDAGRGTLFVAATGEPYPLKIVNEVRRGEVVFDRWNEPAELTAPSDAIDISQLQQAQTG